MATEETRGVNNISEQEGIERIWTLLEKIQVCMMVTWDGQEQHSRPMAARPNKDRGVIYFMTDAKGRKDDEIAKYPVVNLWFSDTRSNKYVS